MFSSIAFLLVTDPFFSELSEVHRKILSEVWISMGVRIPQFCCVCYGSPWQHNTDTVVSQSPLPCLLSMLLHNSLSDIKNIVT